MDWKWSECFLQRDQTFLGGHGWDMFQTTNQLMLMDDVMRSDLNMFDAPNLEEDHHP